MPQIEGFSHVSLSVTDQQRSARWYEEVFGFVTFDKLDEPDYAESVLLHPQRRHPRVQQTAPTPAPVRPGAHRWRHLAFRVASRDELDRGTDRLAELGVTHSPVATAATDRSCACGTPTASSSSSSGGRGTPDHGAPALVVT